MELSIFLAKTWGLYLVLVSLSLLINKTSVQSLFGSMKNDGVVIMSGAFNLIIGVLSVLGHNVWTGPAWVVVVTIFGWIALFKGVIRIAWPKKVEQLVATMGNSSIISGLLIVVLLVGIYLFYSGSVA